MCSPAAHLVQGAFLGRIFDAYGPHVILVPGSFLLVFSTMITSICTQFYQFLIVQGLLTGLSYGTLYVNLRIDLLIMLMLSPLDSTRLSSQSRRIS